jgi:hypothetical protein
VLEQRTLPVRGRREREAQPRERARAGDRFEIVGHAGTTKRPGQETTRGVKKEKGAFAPFSYAG